MGLSMSKSSEDLKYGDFQKMATDPSLSLNEKIGFPDHYREGFEHAIHNDILAKLPSLKKQKTRVLDIGPGCAILPRLMIEHCEKNEQNLFFVDSAEMLDHISDKSFLIKVNGSYPDCRDQLISLGGNFDAIICYSVLHYIFVEATFWRFLDVSLELLAPGGQMLIGDIPNISKRKRFFSSSEGKIFHKNFMNTDEDPIVKFCEIENDKIDDAVIIGLIMRARAQGCDAYWLPQSEDLPMYNRREDILIIKP